MSSSRRVNFPPTHKSSSASPSRHREHSMEFHVVRSETRPTGDQIELVRPIAHDTMTTDAIIRKLATEYGYKTQPLVATKSVTLFVVVAVA